MTDFRYMIERRVVHTSGDVSHVAAAGFNFLEDAEIYFKQLDHSRERVSYWLYETTSTRALVRNSDDETPE